MFHQPSRFVNCSFKFTLTSVREMAWGSLKKVVQLKENLFIQQAISQGLCIIPKSALGQWLELSLRDTIGSI